MKLTHTQNILGNTARVAKRSTRKGFSLVEVIIAIAIVGVLLTGFLGVFGSSQRNINRSLGIKEANVLKDALETEMSVLRSSDSDLFQSAFEKAYRMINESTDQDSAILVYQYRAEPIDSASAGSSDDDGILPPYTEEDGLQGQDFLTQVAVRKRDISSELIESELESNVGSVYAVRMSQLEQDENGELSVLDGAGVEFPEFSQNNIVIVCQAEFFKLPSNAFGYINSGSWNFQNIGAPVATVNIAIRR